MPYIKKENGRREALQKGEPALNAGELNYQLFYYIKHTEKPDKNIIMDYIEQFLGDKPNYQRYNDMTGVLIRCGFEIERRLNNSEAANLLLEILLSYNDEINAYEDRKIIENGDVE